MKKVLSLLLAFVLLIGLVSCGANEEAADGAYALGDMMMYAADASYAGNFLTAAAAAEMAMEAEFAEVIPGQNTGKEIPPEEYGKVIENPFISTAQQNVSTFSADVDTASYTYFRKLVNYGWSLEEIIREAGAAIRTEEMINYFDYGYDAPAEGELFSTRMRIAPCPWNEEAHLLMLGLQAAEPQVATRNNLVFLIDVSGSMASADKLELLTTEYIMYPEYGYDYEGKFNDSRSKTCNLGVFKM